MKKIFIIFAAILMTASIFLPQQVSAQAPEKMSYQAVIRNSSDELVKNTQIGIKISILKASASGTAVYVETQTPTTNINGLASIEIGAGTVISGDFATIDWANGAYFVKTETDPSGGTNYSITVTNQLLSVPYALHAKSAETIVGGIPEADGSETKINAGANITVTGTGTTTSPYIINASGGGAPAAHYIGEIYGGGIIFWIDATGQHGLIAAASDIGVRKWSNGTLRGTGATGDGLYAGAMNTPIIIASQIADNQTGDFAAKSCADFVVSSDGVDYGDWYLPSKYELNLLYLQKDAVGGFTNGCYWSSTENNQDNAWMKDFQDASFNPDLKDNEYRVRAIRAF